MCVCHPSVLTLQATVVTPLMDTLTAAACRPHAASDACSAGAGEGGGGARAMASHEVQALHQQISQRMGQLYTYFKELHDKDRQKLR